LDVIGGIEFDAEGEWGDLRFLNYCVDPEDESLRRRLQADRDPGMDELRMAIAWGSFLDAGR
jgi:hypothetical protein